MSSRVEMPQPRHTVAERFAGLRNFQSKDFWAMLFARPLTILLLVPVADVPWVTPNLITWASTIVKLIGAAALVVGPSYWWGVAGVALINAGLVLDNMDGTLARYRNCSSYGGYFLDKAGDIVTLTVTFAAVGVRVFLYGGDHAGNVLDIAIPLAAGAGQATSWYCKWVAQKTIMDIELRANAERGTLDAYAASKRNTNPSEKPPKRTAWQWIVWFFGAIKSIALLNEVDIPFFMALFVIINRPWYFTRGMCAIYAAAILVGPIMHGMKLRKVLKEYGMK